MTNPTDTHARAACLYPNGCTGCLDADGEPLVSQEVSGPITAEMARYLDQAGKWAAEQLDRLGCARLVLTPGDMTAYTITIVSPAMEQYGQRASQGNYLVALAEGNLYPWHADAELHPRYVTEHWTPHRRHETHTGHVLAAFLNATRRHLTF